MGDESPEMQIGLDKVSARRKLVVSDAGRSQHVYIVGKTGTGKSTLLRNLIAADIEAGRGVGLLDPHGTEAAVLLDAVPAHRIRETIYYDPADTAHPIPFNVLANVPPERRHLVADAVVGAFKSVWGDSWGPRMEYLLLNTIGTLLEVPHTSLRDIRPLLTDERFRKSLLRKVRDPELLSFWLGEFDRYQPRFREEVIAPVLNKVGQLMMSPPLRATLGHPSRGLDMRAMMDRGQIFIANLAKGRLGENKAGLLGAFLVSAFQEAAMQRPTAELAEREGLERPRPFTLYIDEFQSFETESFASILSESRKYGLHLVLAHQFTSQLKPVVRDAIFGNVGSVVSFRVGSSDAEILSRELDSEYPPQRITELPNFHVIAKLASADGASVPRAGITHPPRLKAHGYGESIRKLCRERFGRKPRPPACG